MSNELKGKLSIGKVYGGEKEHMSIQIIDENSRIQFVDLRIGMSEMMQALSGLSRVDCDLSVRGLEHVGKTKEMSTIEFPVAGFRDKEDAIRQAEEHCPYGWEYSDHFNSQDSFFRKDKEPDQWFAKAHIYRWIDLDEEAQS